MNVHARGIKMDGIHCGVLGRRKNATEVTAGAGIA
jgi:hypothetical protein